jgi:hypothetical protein
MHRNQGPDFPTLFFVGTEEVYHLVTHADPEEHSTWALRRADRGWGGLGVVVIVESRAMLPHDRELVPVAGVTLELQLLDEAGA